MIKIPGPGDHLAQRRSSNPKPNGISRRTREFDFISLYSLTFILYTNFVCAWKYKNFHTYLGLDEAKILNKKKTNQIDFWHWHLVNFTRFNVIRCSKSNHLLIRYKSNQINFLTWGPGPERVKIIHTLRTQNEMKFHKKNRLLHLRKREMVKVL